MPNRTPSEIGEAVRNAIASKHITQVRLAAELGVSRAAIIRRLTGEVEFSATEITAVSDLTCVPVTRLLIAS